MMSGSLEAVGGHPALRFERRLAYPVERVWRAITEPEELARWFVTAVHWKPALGETWEAMGKAGEITELDAPRVLAWRWGEEAFRFELRSEPDGCLLVFTHVFEERALGAQHAAGWEAYLNRLESHLAGGYLSEQEAHANIAEMHERYVERFGLDPGVGRRTIAAMRERQLTSDEPQRT
jgi:uncharacterized protein YndB with AHSA1/START domain